MSRSIVGSHRCDRVSFAGHGQQAIGIALGGAREFAGRRWCSERCHAIESHAAAPPADLHAHLAQVAAFWPQASRQTPKRSQPPHRPIAPQLPHGTHACAAMRLIIEHLRTLGGEKITA